MNNLLTGVFAAAVLAVPAFAQSTIETARGPVAFEAVPETVAVFDMAALDTLDALDALGVPVAGATTNTYLPYLAEHAGDLGTLFEPDFEALNALAPDLVIAGGRSSAQVDALSRIAPTIDMTIGTDLVGDALARIEAYGVLFDKNAEADALRATLEAAIADARAAVAGKGKALIVLTNGPKISAYGPGSRFGWLHTALEIEPAVADVEAATHGEAVSFEFIREANPDWLLVVDRVAAIGAEGDSAQATLDNALVAETTAWKTGQVIYLNAAELYIAGGGANSMLNTIRMVTDAFSGNS